MDLNTLWFILIVVLYTGFCLLEGFDFGVGILLPFLGRDQDPARQDLKRRVIINTIGPHWDGNEVWLLTAGGATFAAFPNWYATLFSGFYLAFFLLLLALIARGVAFEFRSKDPSPRWRSAWDWCIFLGSAVPALLIGVLFGNLARGLPIDASMTYVGGFLGLLNPYSLLAGLASLGVFTLYGAVFLSLKTSGELQEKASRLAVRLWLPAGAIMLVMLVATYFSTDILVHLGVNPGIIPISGMVTMLLSLFFLRSNRTGWAFAMLAVTIATTITTLFLIMYPRVMISTLNPGWSLTIYNAASSPYTLTVMTIVALFFVPIVLAYQAWTYWVFRKRIESKPETLTY